MTILILKIFMRGNDILNIVVMDYKTVTNGDVLLKAFEDFGKVIYLPLTSPKNVAEAIKDADVVLCNKTPMTAENMSGAKNLKFIGLFATGYNNIDLEYTNSHGITVCNAGSYSTNAVVQHTFALLLEMTNRVAEYNTFTSKNGWCESETFSPFIYDIMELSNKTLGIVGFGNIGKAVANAARAFGMNVIVNTRTIQKDGITKFVSFDELLEQSDVVSLHCPLNNQSEKLFNAEAFAKMKQNSYFINTARGGIVDENALADSLKSGHLAGAALDTITAEPMRNDCPLKNIPNLIITPHVAWAPKETRERLVKIVYNNLKNFINGNPTNVITV